MSDFIPAEVFHPSTFIAEELEARGWSIERLAREMGGDDWAVDRFALDLYFAVGPTNPGCRMGSMANDIGRAFGTSAELWHNLEAAWLAHPSTKALKEQGHHHLLIKERSDGSHLGRLATD